MNTVERRGRYAAALLFTTLACAVAFAACGSITPADITTACDVIAGVDVNWQAFAKADSGVIPAVAMDAEGGAVADIGLTAGAGLPFTAKPGTFCDTSTPQDTEKAMAEIIAATTTVTALAAEYVK